MTVSSKHRRREDRETANRETAQLEKNFRKCAKDIREKCIAAPRTTDFAILFVPTERLYIEAARSVLSESISPGL